MSNKCSVGVLGASGYAGAELLRLLAGHPCFEVEFLGGDSAAGEAVGDLYPSLAASYPGQQFVAGLPEDLKGLDVLFLALPHGKSQEIVPELLGADFLAEKDAAADSANMSDGDGDDKSGIGVAASVARGGKSHSKEQDSSKSAIMVAASEAGRGKSHGGGPAIIDLAADFRLNDPAEYEQWYGQAHSAPELLGQFSYGLPELFRSSLTSLVAAPGCYPTAAALALAPLLRAGVIAEDGIIVDAASGVSGAGRSLQQHTSFSVADENFTAYGLCGHRHTPEIEQAVGAQVLFTPHLAPMNRGILATCYARPAAGEGGGAGQDGGVGEDGETDSLDAQSLDTEHLLDCYRKAYEGEPFVVVSEQPPATKAVQGSNAAHLSARYDSRTGYVMALCAIDNLGKGAAGQAVQCANLICEFPEDTGLSAAGVYP